MLSSKLCNFEATGTITTDHLDCMNETHLEVTANLIRTNLIGCLDVSQASYSSLLFHLKSFSFCSVKHYCFPFTTLSVPDGVLSTSSGSTNFPLATNTLPSRCNLRNACSLSCCRTSEDWFFCLLILILYDTFRESPNDFLR